MGVRRALKIEKRRIGRGREVPERKARWKGRVADTESIESERSRREKREKERERVKDMIVSWNGW